MSRHLLRLGMIVLIAITGTVVIGEVTGWRWLRTPAEGLLSDTLGREVRIEEPFRVHFVPSPSLRIGRLVIAGPEWADSVPFVHLVDLQILTSWSGLLGNPVSVRAVEFADGAISATRRQDGSSSWQFGELTQSGTAGDQQNGFVPVIDSVQIGNLTLQLDDAASAIRIVAQASSMPPGDDYPRGLTVKGNGSWQTEPVSFDVSIPEWASSAISGNLDGISLDAALGDLKLQFKGDADVLPESPRVAGQMALKGSSLSSLGILPRVTVPETPPFDVTGELHYSPDQIDVTIDRAQFGSSVISAQLTYDRTTTPAKLSGTIAAEKMVLADFAPAVGIDREASGKSQTTGSQPDKLLSKEPFDLSALLEMQADLALDMQRIDLGTDALRPLTGLRGTVRLREGVLTLADLHAEVAGGTVIGNSRLDASPALDTPQWMAELRWKHVDMKRWTRTGNDELLLAGRFSGEALLSSQGRSAAEILGRSSGSLRGSVVDGAISQLILEVVDLDLAQALGVAVTGAEPLATSCALIDTRIEDGVVTPELALLNTRDSIIFAAGRADIKAETLNVRLASAPKDWSPLSLAAPITIKGTFAKPVLSVETTPIAVKALSALVLGAINPIAALLPFIEAPEAEDVDGCAPAIDTVRRRSGSLRSNEPDAEKESENAGESGNQSTQYRVGQ